MGNQKLRDELTEFYFNRVWPMADEFKDKIFEILDSQVNENMTGFQRKALQYSVIADNCTPILFSNSPFYYELGSMMAHCDGDGDFRGILHAGGWNYERYHYLFETQDPELFEKRTAMEDEKLLLICGPYSDTRQHFQFICRPIFEKGLKGWYERALNQLERAETDTERDFIKGSIAGLLALKKISEKFSAKAEELLAAELARPEPNPVAVANYSRIKATAAVTPWNPPQSFYEALNTLAFIRKVVGTLEGIGFNTFGRVDLDLYPFYKRDVEVGRLNYDEALEFVRSFLLTWDCHYDHDMPMVGYSDHELENTYVIGGCDKEGKPVWNDITRMFLQVTQEEKIIFPKCKVRFSAESPEEFLEAACRDVSQGTITELFQNDDCMIPSFVESGYSLEDARDYLITGCWGAIANGLEDIDDGNYINLLKVFEFALYNRQDKMEKCGICFKSFDNIQSFEELYRLNLENLKAFFDRRQELTLRGKPIWTEIDPCPLSSLAYEGCLDNMKDLTAGGFKYHNEVYMCTGFPNVVDSLLAIKKLCFDEKKYSFAEMLRAVKADWQGYEEMRQDAIRCPGWGDGSDESNALASRFQNDLFEMLNILPTLWEGGKVKLGHLGYTELRWWGEVTLATPDGRHSGDYMSQGLTPSRLKKIDSATSVVSALASLDKRTFGSNTVTNIILPSGKMTPKLCAAFVRATAKSSMCSLQLNCVSKEELLDAQIHPENHKNLIVRVCGFSARFTALSKGWQEEFLSRNFYK